MEFTEKNKKNFWAKVNKTDTCWLWTRTCQKSGHGKFRVNGKMEMAHRVSWYLAGNTIPEGLCILHSSHSICGNRNCVNPVHLRTGTQAENSADRILDGTTSRGTKQRICKLTEEKVKAIRLRKTENQRLLGEEFGVTGATISYILSKKSWYWLD